MPETTVYTLRGQAGSHDILRRIRAQSAQSGDCFVDTVTAVLRTYHAYLHSPTGALMRELHARGRLHGFKSRYP